MDIITKKEAKLLGLKRYYTGKPCKHGHDSERMVSNGDCVSCLYDGHKKYVQNNTEHLKEYNKQFKNDNKERIKLNQKEWHKNNKEKNNTRSREYYQNNKKTAIANRRKWSEENKEKQQAYSKAYNKANKKKIAERHILWRKNNPEKYLLSKQEYLNRRKEATPVWYEKELVKQLYLKRDELSQLWGIVLHVDHAVPLQGKNVCGLHCWANLQLLEASINHAKNNKY